MSVLPGGRLVVAAVVVGVAILPLGEGAAAALLVGNLILLAAAVVDLLLTPSPGALGVARVVERVHVLDAPSPLSWRITNGGERTAVVHMADALPPSLRAADRRVRLRVPPGGTVGATTSIRPARRGSIPLGTITARVRGPLGLVWRQADRAVPDTLRVHPPFPSRDEAELMLVQARRQREGLRTVRLRGQGTDFDSLREYTPDDETRRIDWAATARALKPIVRTYRAERNQQVLILLDHGRTMAGRMGRVAPSRAADADVSQSPRLEHAMDAAMALTRVATGMGDRVGLVAFADSVTATVPPRPGLPQLTRVVETLADVDTLLVEPDYRGAFADALARYRRRALVVVLTDLAAAPVAESLRPALPLLGRRHLVVVASPSDPAVAAWSRWVPTDAAAAYRMSAATRAQEERRRSATLLAAAGATVVDAPPSVLPGRLVDAYLDLKSAGRL